MLLPISVYLSRAKFCVVVFAFDMLMPVSLWYLKMVVDYFSMTSGCSLLSYHSSFPHFGVAGVYRISFLDFDLANLKDAARGCQDEFVAQRGTRRATS